MAEGPSPTPAPTPDPRVDEFIGLLGMVKPPSPKTYNYWSEVLGCLAEAHGETRFRVIMAYCFQHERYGRGIKTVKQDKADWFSEKFDEVAERKIADEEFEAKRGAKAAKHRVNGNAPDYLKNPSGNVQFGKSVV